MKRWKILVLGLIIVIAFLTGWIPGFILGVKLGENFFKLIKPALPW